MSISNKLRNSFNEILKKFNGKNKKQILLELRRVINEDNPSNRTITIRFSVAKKLFKNNINDKEFISQIKPPIGLTQSVLDNNLKIRDSRKLFKINEDNIEILLSFDNSDNIYELCIYLLLISGRRFSEISEGKFKKSGKNHVSINEIRKRIDDDRFNCKFLILTNSTNFIRNHKKFINLLNFNKSDKRISNLHKNCGLYIKKIFNNDWKLHLLRSIYVGYSFKFRNVKNYNFNTFIQKSLCQRSPNTSLHYNFINIDIEKDII